MAAVFDLLSPHKIAILHGNLRKDAKTLELQTAKEILAEVFGVRISEVDEMIANRSSGCHECQREKGLWPSEFQLEE
jgi:hypothetical protein